MKSSENLTLNLPNIRRKIWGQFLAITFILKYIKSVLIVLYLTKTTTRTHQNLLKWALDMLIKRKRILVTFVTVANTKLTLLAK